VNKGKETAGNGKVAFSGQRGQQKRGERCNGKTLTRHQTNVTETSEAEEQGTKKRTNE